ncbi:hypothetical protein VNO77_43583 [Canavalia gladiata]|uniref:Uncharacterized protein n=1 Tax=Canavalia gladiata TaxID=3824 RepID=A0AAN9PPJ9_CANGL
MCSRFTWRSANCQGLPIKRPQSSFHSLSTIYFSGRVKSDSHVWAAHPYLKWISIINPPQIHSHRSSKIEDSYNDLRPFSVAGPIQNGH